jgi:cytochrome c peroxidase
MRIARKRERGLLSLVGVLPIALVALATVAGCSKVWPERCADRDCLFTADEWRLVQGLARDPDARPPEDPSNQVLDTSVWPVVAAAASMTDVPPSVRLGWRLYHDPRFSGDLTSPKDTVGRATVQPRPSDAACAPQLNLSCASCHDPQLRGGDFTSVPRNVSNGKGWYDVNGQQTLNVAFFHPYFYWNGRTSTLWAQAAQVMKSGVSMGGDTTRTFWTVARYYLDDADWKAVFDGQTGPSAAARDDVRAVADLMPATVSVRSTNADIVKAYKDAFAKAVAADPTLMTRAPDLDTRVHVSVAKAIAAYEWFLRSDRSRFDQFARPEAGAAPGAFSSAEKRGLKLFIGRAGCINCHNTSMFSDGKFHDVGVPQAGPHVPTVDECITTACDCRMGGDGPTCLPTGAFGGLQKRANEKELGLCGKYDDRVGAGETPDECPLTKPDVVKGSWRTPSLRDVADTGPYMHDGVFQTLADVVWHYDQGGSLPIGTDGSELAPLHLTAQDRDDLVAFLGSLTGKAGPGPLVVPPPTPDGGYCLAAPTTSDGGAPTEAGAEAGMEAGHEAGTEAGGEAGTDAPAGEVGATVDAGAADASDAGGDT